MTKRSSIYCILILCLLLTNSVYGVEFRGIKFTSIPMFDDMNSPFGHTEFRFQVTNTTNSSHNIRIFLDPNLRSNLNSVSKAYEIGAQDSKTVSLSIPKENMYMNGIKAEVDGYECDKKLLGYNSLYTYRRKIVVLTDAKISKSDFKTKLIPSLDIPNSASVTSFDGGHSKFSTDWRTYSQYGYLIFYASTLDRLPEKAMNAIYDYVRIGGALVILGNRNMPDDFVFNETTRTARIYNAKFGICAILPEDYLTRSPSPSSLNVIYVLKYADRTEQGFAPKELVFNSDVINQFSAGALLFVVLAFAIFMGPINIFYLNKINKKIWVFWTVPAASAICCIIIFTYYIVGEASILKIKKEALTILDENKNQAITIGTSTFFSSSSRPSGLHYNQTTEITTFRDRSYGRNYDSKNINLDTDQHLTTGWITSKIPRALATRDIQTRRERVAFSSENGKVYMINGLGAEINRIIMKNKTGKVYTAESIPAGSKVEMQQNKQNNTRDTTPYYAVLNAFYRGRYKSLFTNYSVAIAPNSYVADLSATPFLPKHFNTNDRQEHSVVLGLISKGDIE